MLVGKYEKTAVAYENPLLVSVKPRLDFRSLRSKTKDQRLFIQFLTAINSKKWNADAMHTLI